MGNYLDSRNELIRSSSPGMGWNIGVGGSRVQHMVLLSGEAHGFRRNLISHLSGISWRPGLLSPHWAQLFEVVVVVISLSFPPQRLAHSPPLSLESVVIISPLPVLRRGDSPAPSLPSLPSEVSSRPRQSHPPPLCTHPRAPVTMATPELIAALILLKFSLLCQHPTPTLSRRVGGQGCWARVPSIALL